jgi:hypothetical protein
MSYQNESNEEFSLVQECTDDYYYENVGSRVRINILIPKRFKFLWMHKLSELKTTMKEIEEYEHSDEEISG